MSSAAAHKLTHRGIASIYGQALTASEKQIQLPQDGAHTHHGQAPWAIEAKKIYNCYVQRRVSILIRIYTSQHERQQRDGLDLEDLGRP
jgi:hypothetical protein